jgi:antitoxin component of RelBE/YafQ-DinJ toxin-antitoxin module
MKLTLNIDPQLIDQIKEVAKKKNMSLSKVTESLFKTAIQTEREPFHMKSLDELPEWIKKLTVSTEPVPDFDHKAEYHKHLEEKHGL